MQRQANSDPTAEKETTMGDGTGDAPENGSSAHESSYFEFEQRSRGPRRVDADARTDGGVGTAEADVIIGAAPPPRPLQVSLVIANSDSEEQASRLTVEPGGSTGLTVNIRNDGDTVATYAVTVEGLPHEWSTVEADRVYLNPWGTGGDQEGSVTVRLHPPRSAEALAKSWPLTLWVRRCDRPELGIEQSLNLSLTILPFEDVSASLRPQDLSARWRARFQIEFVNQGNREVTPSIVLRDAKNACSFAVKGRGAVSAGARQCIECAVRPRRPRWFGAPVMHTFAAEVATLASRAPTLTLGGGFRQNAVFPKWLLKLIPVLVALTAGTAAAVALSQANKVGPSVPSTPTVPTAAQSPTTPARSHPASTPSTTTPPTVAVPDVVGKSVDQARTLLSAAGFSIGSITPSGFPSGAPIDQQWPAAGAQTKKGAAVNLVLRSIDVPDLQGMTIAQASDRLSHAGLGSPIAQPAGAGTNAVVDSQDPAPGTPVPPGQTVTLQMREVFGERDAQDVAQHVAQGYASASGVTDASAQTCASSGQEQWACAIAVHYTTAAGGDASCTVNLAIMPTTDPSGIRTSSGLFGTDQVSQTDCPAQITGSS